MLKRVLILLLLLLIVSSTGPALASAPTGLTMTTEAAFDGRFKFGHWLPIFVTVENSGADLNGEVRARISGRSGQMDFVLPAELATGSRKQFTLYVLPNSFSREIEVELLQNDDIILSQKVGVDSVANDKYVIGVAATEAANLRLLSTVTLPGRRENPDLVNISLEQIPDRPAGLDLFDTLIINDVDTGQLTPDQQRAIETWVLGGGRLILGGGSGAARTVAGLPDKLAVGVVNGQYETPALPALEAYAGEPIQAPGPFLLTDLSPAAGTTILAAETIAAGGQTPLIVERQAGNGYVDFIALDLAQAPFNTWPGLVAFAGRLLSPGAAWPSNQPVDISPHRMRDSQLSSALTNLPALDLPSIRFLGILLMGYILLVGPVNYLVLRRLDRLAWAWGTIPLLTLAFSGMAYFISYQLRGSDIIINQLSVMELNDDGQVSDSRTYVGIFSPRRQAYDVEVRGQALIRPLGEGYYDPWSGEVTVGSMAVVQGEPARVKGLSVNQWSMQSFVAESTPTGTPRLEVSLTAGPDRITGRAVNRSAVTLKDVIIILNNNFQKLGDIPAQQAAEIRLDHNHQNFFGRLNGYTLYQANQNTPASENREVAFKQRVLDSTVFNQANLDVESGVMLLAWLDDSPLEVSLANSNVTAQRTSLLYGRMPVEFDPASSGVPPGFSRTETVALTGDAHTCHYGYGNPGYFVNSGSAELKITLPAGIRQIEPSRLDLYLRTDGGVQVSNLTINLYDSARDEWIPLENVAYGPNSIDQPERFYNSAEAALPLRLTGEALGNAGGCIYFDLAFEGESS